MLKKHYLALGDSYTIGESVAETDRWPVQLASSLSAAGFPTAPPRIIATTGWTTGELIAAIDAAALTATFDLVSLSIGVNNQYRGLPLENFRKEFAQLLDRALQFAGGDSAKVFVVSIPDWSLTPFAKGRDATEISRQIDAFNTVKREETRKKNVSFINITPLSRLVDRHPEYIANDGLHYSGTMHLRWVEEILRDRRNFKSTEKQT